MKSTRRPTASTSFLGFRAPGARLATLIVPLAAITACQREAPQEKLASPAGSVVKPTLAAARPAPSARAKKPTPGPLAEWMEARNYRLRVLEAKPCDTPEDGKTPNSFRLGVTIEVEATEDSLTAPVVVSPKAATIVKGGKVFRALTDPEATPSCDDLIAFTQLNPLETKHGTLVFEAPNEAYLRSAVFTFKPPRWGGEAALQVNLPNCFGENCS